MKEITIDNITYQIIATYYDEVIDKNYIIYTDKNFDEENKLILYSSLYKINNNNIKFIKIESPEDKFMVERMLREIIESFENKNNV